MNIEKQFSGKYFDMKFLWNVWGQQIDERLRKLKGILIYYE